MNRLMLLATLIAISLTQGCAISPQRAADNDAARPRSAPTASAPSAVNPLRTISVAHVTEIPVEENAPPAEGHPMTSVVVTQCNLIVAVYVTMPDGRLLRFDRSAQMPADQLISMAYTATRSERVEVSCNDVGSAGFEHHEPL